MRLHAPITSRNVLSLSVLPFLGQFARSAAQNNAFRVTFENFFCVRSYRAGGEEQVLLLFSKK